MVVTGGFASTVAPVVAESPSGGDQLYEFAPAAVSVAANPSQIMEELTVITGIGLTVTTDVAVFEHPEAIPVTVYVVVVEGLAVTVAPLVADNPDGGDQEYDVPPLAVSVAGEPAQMVSELTVTTGSGVTVTIDVAVPVQPEIVPVTV